MKIIVGCEESQAVTKEFRALGHEAYSCDVLPCSGGHPEWHIQGDIIPLLNDSSWDMGIFFPPCTHLAVSGAKHFKAKQADGRQQAGINFFLQIANCKIPRWSIENPIGIMSRIYRKPDQIVQPWQFGHEATKTTCIWLKNLPLLRPTEIVGKGARHITKSGKSLPEWYNLPPSEDRGNIRSKTFTGIAQAMASQWSSPAEYQSSFL